MSTTFLSAEVHKLSAIVNELTASVANLTADNNRLLAENARLTAELDSCVELSRIRAAEAAVDESLDGGGDGMMDDGSDVEEGMPASESVEQLESPPSSGIDVGRRGRRR